MDTLDLPDGRRTPSIQRQELGVAHADLHITSEEFDEVGAEIAGALDHFKVPEREKQELLAVIVSKKAEVVFS